MESVELKRKVTLKRKVSQPKKSKWWLWLLLLVVIAVVVILCVKYCSSSNEGYIEPIDDITIIEETTTPNADGTTEEVIVVETVTETPATAETPVPQPTTKSDNNAYTGVSGDVEQLVREVIQGKYGNGAARKQKLGNRYSEIQQKVNEKYRENK